MKQMIVLLAIASLVLAGIFEDPAFFGVFVVLSGLFIAIITLTQDEEKKINTSESFRKDYEEGRI